MSLCAAIIFLAIVFLVPIPSRRSLSRWLTWLPHRLLEKPTPFRSICFQAWVVVLAITTMVAQFLDGQIGGLIDFWLAWTFVALSLDCLWTRRPLSRKERSGLDLNEVFDLDSREKYFLVGPEPALLKLASHSRLLSSDLQQIGIEELRLVTGKYLPGTLPEGIAATPVPEEIFQALLEMHAGLKALTDRQAGELLAAREASDATTRQVLSLEDTVARHEDTISSLQSALETARKQSVSPFRSSFPNASAEAKALLDRFDDVTGGTQRDLVRQMESRLELTTT